MDEIPTAFREIESQPESTTKISSNLIIIVFTVIGFFSIILFYFARNPQQTQANSDNQTTQPVVTDVDSNVKNNNTDNSSSANSDIDVNGNQENTTISSATPEESVTENILGHLPYKEASLADLVPITNDGRIRLTAKAAERFKAMQNDAQRSGILLVPISGFRSVAEQEYLFFGVKEQRQQVVSKRAEVSAPPGYSEHHTGYAVDIGDGNIPETNLNPRFDQTPAYQWLSQNAAKYSFELSFTPDNLQGINYEPWHWRYIGDTKSLETFYKARNLSNKLNDNN